MTGHDETAWLRLHTIAGVLRVPVEQLCGGDAPEEASASTECIRLWSRLTTDEGRASVLRCLRDELAREAGGPSTRSVRTT